MTRPPEQRLPSEQAEPREPARPSFGLPDTQPPSAQMPDGPGQTVEPDGSAYDRHGHEPRFEYAGRWRRLIAAGIDGVISGVILLAVGTPIWGYHRTMHAGKGSIGHQIALYVTTVVLWFLYYSLPHGRWGQTPGKRAMNIRVVRVGNGGAISYGQAAWRLVFELLISGPTRFLSGVFAIVGIVGLADLAWILWDPRRQALHDKVAQTIVVTARPNLPNPYERR